MTNPPNRPPRPSRPIPAMPDQPPATGRPTRSTKSIKAPRPSGAQQAFGAEEIEKQLAVRDVMNYAVRLTRAVQLAKQMESYKSRPFLLGLVAIPSLILSLYAYAARPDWVYGPQPTRFTPGRKDAYNKFAIYLAAQRIESYRAANGVLPASLAELEEEWPGISYSPSGSTFELSVRGESGGQLVYQSDHPVREFLGSSPAQLRERGQ